MDQMLHILYNNALSMGFKSQVNHVIFSLVMGKFFPLSKILFHSLFEGSSGLY